MSDGRLSKYSTLSLSMETPQVSDRRIDHLCKSVRPLPANDTRGFQFHSQTKRKCYQRSNRLHLGLVPYHLSHGCTRQPNRRAVSMLPQHGFRRTPHRQSHTTIKL